MKTQLGSRFIRQVFNPPAFNPHSTEETAYYKREWQRMHKPEDYTNAECERRLWPKPLSKSDSELPTFEADGTMPGGYSFNSIKNNYSDDLGKYQTMTDILPLREFQGQTEELIKLKAYPQYMMEEFSVLVTYEMLEVTPNKKEQFNYLYCLPPGYYKPRKDPFNTEVHLVLEKNMEVAPGEEWGVYQLHEGYLWVGAHCLLLEEEAWLISSKKPRPMRMHFLFDKATGNVEKTKFCIEIPGSFKGKRVCVFDSFSLLLRMLI